MFPVPVRAGRARCIALCVVMCAVAVLQVGCGIRITPTPEPVTILFVCPEEDQGFYTAIGEAFAREYPHITVEPVHFRMQRAIEADVFVGSQFFIRYIQDQLELLDLDPLIQHDESFDRPDFYAGTFELFTEEEGLWGIPTSIDPTVMFYNVDLFDRYNVPYPEMGWTWEDFAQTARPMFDPGAGVYGYAPDYELSDPLAFIYQHGGRVFDDLLNPTRTTFDDPLNIEAMEWYAGLMYKDDVAATPVEARQAYGVGGYIQFGIEQKRLGMWTGSLSERGGQLRREEWDMRWGIVPLPQDAQAATFADVQGLMVVADTESPDACWKWIAFLTRQVPRGGMPARRSLAESTVYEDEVGGDVAAAARASVESALLFSPDLYDMYESLRFLDAAMYQIVNNQVPPQEALGQAQQDSTFR